LERYVLVDCSLETLNILKSGDYMVEIYTVESGDCR